jgi:Txe/YoeB family toxin of Txe-Axe toxin-antitoxin module
MTIRKSLVVTKTMEMVMDGVQDYWNYCEDNVQDVDDWIEAHEHFVENVLYVIETLESDLFNKICKKKEIQDNE